MPYSTLIEQLLNYVFFQFRRSSKRNQKLTITKLIFSRVTEQMLTYLTWNWRDRLGQ